MLALEWKRISGITSQMNPSAYSACKNVEYLCVWFRLFFSWSLRSLCCLVLSWVSNVPLLHSLYGFRVVLFLCRLHKCCEYNVAHVYPEK